MGCVTANNSKLTNNIDAAPDHDRKKPINSSNNGNLGAVEANLDANSRNISNKGEALSQQNGKNEKPLTNIPMSKA